MDLRPHRQYGSRENTPGCSSKRTRAHGRRIRQYPRSRQRWRTPSSPPSPSPYFSLPRPAETTQLIFGHCDLLCGNVIIHPHSSTSCPNTNIETVSFIDYEYATPAPVAFDLANHFAEWGGLDCDYTALPTRSTRRAFLREYLASYRAHLPETESTAREEENFEDQVERLCAEVDLFRGIPGFYWGIWALIQATISQIDFDYAKYAEVRLGEYWDWRNAQGRPVGIGEREERWGSE